jgi:hypothetical protein
MKQFLEKPVVLRAGVAFFFLWVSFSVGYWAITKYDIQAENDEDVNAYIRMSQGESLETISRPFRYRVVVPWVAGLMPATSTDSICYFDMDAQKRITLQFGIVNVIGMAVTAFLLFLFCCRVGLSVSSALLGGILFLTSFYTVNYGAVPYVEAWTHAFLVAGMLAVHSRRYFVLVIVSLAGIFVKETYLLLLPIALLLHTSWPERVKSVVSILPACAAYAVFRWGLYPADTGYDHSFGAAASNLFGLSVQLNRPERLGALGIEGVESFGFCWILLGIYLVRFRKENPLLTRSLLLLPVVMAVPFLLDSDFGRIWFLAFPVVLPAAAIVLEKGVEKLSSGEK